MPCPAAPVWIDLYSSRRQRRWLVTSTWRSLSRLADITTPREQAVWLVVPEEGGGGPLLDRVPVPLTYASQFVHVDGLFAVTEGEAR